MDDHFDLVVANGPAQCSELRQTLLRNRKLIIASNRGPVTFHTDAQGQVQPQVGVGGLVTALAGLAQHVEACWIASAQTPEDRAWSNGEMPLGEDGHSIQVQFVAPDAAAYEGYYSVIANPLLWFLQHAMWDIFRAPTIDRTTWLHWENGYVAVNKLFADAIS